MKKIILGITIFMLATFCGIVLTKVMTTTQPCICSPNFDAVCNKNTKEYLETASYCTCDVVNAKMLKEEGWITCNDGSFCEEPININFRVKCIFNVAVNTGNISLCERIENYHYGIECKETILDNQRLALLR